MPFGWAAAAAAIGSAVIGSQASSSAAGAQVNASNNAINAQQTALASARSDLGPYRTGGSSALQQLMYMTNLASSGAAPSKEQFLKGYQNGPLTYDWNGQSFNSTDALRTALSNNYLKETANNGIGLQSAAVQSSIDGAISQITSDAKAKNPAIYDEDAYAKAQTAYQGQAGALTKPFAFTQDDPSYQFRLDQGNTALTRQMSALGLNGSTPGLRSLMNYNQGMASTEYQASFGRDLATKGNTYSMLAAMAGMGQNSAAMTGSNSMNAGGSIGAAAMAGGNAAAGGIMNSAGAVNNSIQGGLGNYMYQQRYNQTMGMYQSFLNPSTTQNTPMVQEAAPGQFSTMNPQYG